jgi:phenylalanyl-tRNA synthetase alpha chain
VAELSGQDKLKELYDRAKQTIDTCSSPEELGHIRVQFLGKKGELTAILRSLSQLPSSERPLVGQLANETRQKLEQDLDNKRELLDKQVLNAQLKTESIDITLPGKRPRLGKKHLISQTIEEIVDIFLGLGYRVAEGPEVELDYYNFEALNTPPDHPARSLQDTFYVQSDTKKDEVLLRTHTSPVQIRVMEKTKPPVYVIAPGKAYRRDMPDPTHSPMFHQVEGLAVDEKITFANLKGTLEAFIHEMFGKDRTVRLRPHFFPFTEPSAEVDVSCILCNGQGCRVCKKSGWLEILGAGMVDPNVLKIVGYDPEKVSGFAFGMGVERIAMLKHGINDIRLFFENDLRFLSQF